MSGHAYRMAAQLINIMFYDYLIAGIHIRCSIPYKLIITRESIPFLLDPVDGDPHVTALFRVVENNIQIPADSVEAHGLSICRDAAMTIVYHKLTGTSDAYARVLVMNDTLFCDISAKSVGYLASTQNLLNLLSLEILLLNSASLLIHSSFIRVDGNGVLFSAPSGTGKSTQADLWQAHRSAEIINGDRAALRRIGNAWTAWGLPYAGTSGIYRNESAPVSAIVVLRQSKTNAVRRLRPSEALRYLYPELTFHRWEEGSVEKAMDLLTDLVTSVPVFLLECRPDEEAVRTLESALEEVF